MNDRVVRVAVPCPLRRLFDYLPPAEGPGEPPPRGVRVRVPFGRGSKVGLVMGHAPESAVAGERLRPVAQVLDPEPLLPPPLLELLEWAAAYYHHPPGEVIAAALPALLRQGRAPGAASGFWRLTAAGRALDVEDLARAPRQRVLWLHLQGAPGALSEEALDEHLPGWRSAARALAAKGLAGPCAPPPAAAVAPDLELTPDQAAAVAAVDPEGGFAPVVLEGVTGSGKTEVYLRIAAACLERGRQTLVLVPEIGLTPQMGERFRARFGDQVALLHSGVADGERLRAWAAARRGDAPVLVGTRSALFVPLARPGAIIVDEEHDPSFKQQEGFRYSARDLAVVRARLEGVPVVLGSATPSLETLHNVAAGRYGHRLLPQRAGGRNTPLLRVVDVRRRPLRNGLSDVLLEAIAGRLGRGEQVLLFINRRGWSPTLLCHQCGWVAECRHCSARMTFHQNDGQMRCHHCGARLPPPEHCPACRGEDLRFLGRGTERIEEHLQGPFPGARVVRIDRDSTRRKGSMEAALEAVQAGRVDILVGTQMLSKGHHLPGVTLVGILDVDQGLHALDFRAGERLAQQVEQVAGRAGRGDRPGEVLLQTHHPDHPLLRALVEGGYRGFLEPAIAERREAGLPPFTAMALVRAEHGDEGLALGALEAVAQAALPLAGEVVQVLGPVPAPIGRVAGRHRCQLLLQAPRRADLQAFLDAWVPLLEAAPALRRVRWSLDVDPLELA